MTTVLVTGVGAIIGYGILRSLRCTGDSIQLVGADVHHDAVGQAWTDRFFVAPPTASVGYADWLQKTIIENSVDLIIPGIEQDLHYLSDNRHLLSGLNTRVVLNDQRLINISRDKWLMDRELLSIASSTRIPSYTEGGFSTLSTKLGLPFIIKPKCSYASKGLLRIKNEDDFELVAKKLGSHLIAQPIVGSDDEEYTVAIFGDGMGEVSASIILQRRLAADGSTAKACVRKCSDLSSVVEDLCRHFKPIGPTNLQFRKTVEGWKLLEINPRISSSTSLRCAFGYNEAKMCIDFYFHEREITQPVIRQGFAARYIEDMVVYDRDHF